MSIKKTGIFIGTIGAIYLVTMSLTGCFLKGYTINIEEVKAYIEEISNEYDEIKSCRFYNPGSPHLNIDYEVNEALTEEQIKEILEKTKEFVLDEENQEKIVEDMGRPIEIRICLEQVEDEKTYLYQYISSYYKNGTTIYGDERLNQIEGYSKWSYSKSPVERDESTMEEGPHNEE